MERVVIDSSMAHSVAHDPDRGVVEIAYKANRNGVRQVWQVGPFSSDEFAIMTGPGASFGTIFNGLKRQKIADGIWTEVNVGMEQAEVVDA